MCERTIASREELSRVQLRIIIGGRRMRLSLVHTHICRCVCAKVKEELHECETNNERRRGERVKLSSENGDYMRVVLVSNIIALKRDLRNRELKIKPMIWMNLRP